MNTKESLSRDSSVALGNHMVMTHYVDASLHYNILMGKAVTGILYFISKTHIDWFSNK